MQILSVLQENLQSLRVNFHCMKPLCIAFRIPLSPQPGLCFLTWNTWCVLIRLLFSFKLLISFFSWLEREYLLSAFVVLYHPVVVLLWTARCNKNDSQRYWVWKTMVHEHVWFFCYSWFAAFKMLFAPSELLLFIIVYLALIPFWVPGLLFLT